MADITSKDITITICKKCGEVVDYIPNDKIEMQCEFCGGDIFISDKSEEEWYELYLEAHPNLRRAKVPPFDELYAWISEQLAPTFSGYSDEHRQRADETLAEWEEESRKRAAKPHCPKCYSTNIGKAQQGFKWGRAIGAAALTGFLDVAAVAGAAGSNKMVNCCNECGHTWK